MGFLFITILIIAVIALVVYHTLPERRKQEELLRRQIFLNHEKVEAERAKQYARIAGEKTREKIDKIASAK